MLHDLGQIAYFADIPELATKIIMHPEWLDARITQVIDSQPVTDAGGVLSRAERIRLWAGLAEAEDDPGLPDRLIRMMEAFDLAYRVGNADDSPDVALSSTACPTHPRPTSTACGVNRVTSPAYARSRSPTSSPPARLASPPGSSPVSTATPPDITGATASYCTTATPSPRPGRC